MIVYPLLSVVFVVICSAVLSKAVAGNEYGVLVAEYGASYESFCIIYYPEFSDLPNDRISAEHHFLMNKTAVDYCNFPPSNLHGEVVLLSQRNCSLAAQAEVIQKQGGSAALFVTPGGSVGHINVNSSASEYINITVALISELSVERLQTMSSDIQAIKVQMFSPTALNVDLSLLVIWLMAMLSVVIGSYWSGLIRYTLYIQELNKLPGSDSEQVSKSEAHRDGEESALNVSPLLVGVFVLCMGAMLLLLYFFFDVLVYLIMALFVMASVISVYNCIEPLLPHVSLGNYRLPQCNFCSVRCAVEIQQLLVLLFAISLSVTWFVLRKERFSWILQDILGVAFSINMLKFIRLPNLKICTVLLVLLFFYDIFFVFITPFLTVKGESVMVEVATGGNSQEQLPMVFRVPHFQSNDLAVCYQQYSLLGFGDILVPGLLVSYCHGYDLMMEKRKVYFITTSLSYGIGLIITFAGLYLMSTPQPALLYLVPATLLPPILLSWCRGEFLTLWSGVKVNPPSDAVGPPSVESLDQNNRELPCAPQPSTPQPLSRKDSTVSETASEDGEKKFLVK